MRVGLLAAAAVISVALAMVGALAAAPPGRPGKPAGRAAPRTAAPTVTPAPPSLPRSAINRQDRVDRAHAARESRALDDRPLLSELPLELGDVTIDAAGLTADGRRVAVDLDGPDPSTADAAYRQALAALGDRGSAYEPRWTGTPADAKPAAATPPAVAQVAAHYALAARNWSAATRRRAWAAQLQLADAAQRRALRRSRPTRRELATLAADRASNIAVIADLTITRRRGPRATVRVRLHERASTAGQPVTATSTNQVALIRRGGQWRVTGWTVLPDAAP